MPIVVSPAPVRPSNSFSWSENPELCGQMGERAQERCANAFWCRG